MDDNLYFAIVAKLSGDDPYNAISTYITSNYEIDNDSSTMSRKSRIQLAMNKFNKIASRYRLEDDDLIRIKDGFTVIPEYDINDRLSDIYNDVLGGVNKMFYKVKQEKYAIPRRRIEQWLKGNTDSTIFTPKKKKTAISKPILSSRPNERWQADVTHAHIDGDNKKLILTVIDHLTKRVWLDIVENENGPTIYKSIVKAIERAGEAPRILQTDNKILTIATRDMLRNEYGTIHITASSNNPKSVGLVENANKNVKRVLSLILKEKRTTDWSELLDEVEYVINNTYQSSIKMTPNEAVERYDEAAANLYENAIRMMARHGHTTKPYKIGDKVRLSIYVVRPALRKTELRKLTVKDMTAISKALHRDITKITIPNWLPDTYTIIAKRGRYEYMLEHNKDWHDDEGKLLEDYSQYSKGKSKGEKKYFTHDLLKKA